MSVAAIPDDRFPFPADLVFQPRRMSADRALIFDRVLNRGHRFVSLADANQHMLNAHRCQQGICNYFQTRNPDIYPQNGYERSFPKIYGCHNLQTMGAR
jgi:hypothetical protein